jgi:hypothetical protein
LRYLFCVYQVTKLQNFYSSKYGQSFFNKDVSNAQKRWYYFLFELVGSLARDWRKPFSQQYSRPVFRSKRYRGDGLLYKTAGVLQLCHSMHPEKIKQVRYSSESKCHNHDDTFYVYILQLFVCRYFLPFSHISDVVLTTPYIKLCRQLQAPSSHKT